ncbi:LuxR family transcriptional regulator [Planotetraspora kaengkrachanensis]|uniref:LuxR family transcriptional regulator n=1 Tax=Planotetraspora kaengkrachanensis TaxID=575193 RepID=A0A8J3LVV3_9ACTN|nr:LuxR family transcriptional regulator [Planotetraspora kaengkrachanensis]
MRQVGNLPADLTSFVGRKRELARIRQLLVASRLVTLTGVGGVGKTRLALRAAAEQHRAFDAVWLVDLTGLDDPHLVAETVAATVGLRDESTACPLDGLAQLLASQRTLLLLDNCEHLSDSCAELADRLLRSASELRIIATSRQSLGIVGEQGMRVAPLAVPDSGRPLTAKAPELYDGVALFLERAVAAVPEFTLTQGNQAAVAELCRRLEGIPLAIELAAVRLRALSVDALVEHLNDRYRFLTRGSRTASPRQRTLHALVNWSFQLLSASEQTLWTRLSIFPGDFDLETVESVCAGDGIEGEDVLDLIDGLLDKSLLQREEHDRQVRYRMLETLREFGRQRLGADERRALLRRHRDRYRLLVDQAVAEWFGPRQVSWFTRLRLERAHLRAALEFCLQEPGEAEAGLHIATLLYETHWKPNAFYSEGHHWLARMLEAAPGPTAMRAEALCAEADVAYTQGDIAAAERLVEEGRALACELGHAGALGLAALVSGMAANITGDYERAAALFEDAVTRNTEAGNTMRLACALLSLGTAADYLGDRRRAAELIERSLALSEAHGESWIRAWVMIIVALDAWQHGDSARAISLLRESLVVGRDFDDRLIITIGMRALAWTLTGTGDFIGAAHMLGAADKVRRTAGISAHWSQHAEFHERCVATLRDGLGDAAFAEAVRQGGEWTLGHATAEALGTPRVTDKKDDEIDAPAPSPLTRREHEVAELVARGLGNKEISSELVIAQRTAESHVEHIMTKLGFKSRTQIASWMTARKVAGGGDR